MSRIKTEDRIIQLEEMWHESHPNGDEPPTDCFVYCPLGLAPVNEEPIYFLYRYDYEKKEMCYHWIKEKYIQSIFAMGKNYTDVVPDEIDENELFMLEWNDHGICCLLHLKDYIDSHNINEVHLANHKTTNVKRRRV